MLCLDVQDINNYMRPNALDFNWHKNCLTIVENVVKPALYMFNGLRCYGNGRFYWFWRLICNGSRWWITGRHGKVDICSLCSWRSLLSHIFTVFFCRTNGFLIALMAARCVCRFCVNLFESRDQVHVVVIHFLLDRSIIASNTLCYIAQFVRIKHIFGISEPHIEWQSAQSAFQQIQIEFKQAIVDSMRLL